MAAQHGGVLVVTDRYPPNLAGGAELSLHIMLCEIARSQRLTVVVLGEDAACICEEMRDGISVIRLPRRAAWPFHHWTKAKFDRISASPAFFRFASFAIGCLRPLFCGSPYAFHRRFHAFAIWLLNGTNLAAATDLLVARDRAGPGELQALIARIRPRLIHADNHDAICAVAGGHGLPVVGFVRDNRFLCGRQDQAATIRDRPCGQCDVACIEGSGVSARFNRALIQQTAMHRRNCLAAMTRVVVASGYLERQMGSIVSVERVRRIANPIDHIASAAAVVKPGGSSGNIAVIGSLTGKKGQMALLRWLPAMQARIPDLHLHFIGDGPDKLKLAAFVEAQRASAMVTLHGSLSRQALYQVLSSSQIVAIPSLWAEPFGRVAIEAAAMALPVVAFAVGGLMELIEPNVTGILVPAGDFGQFAEALAYLAATPEIRRRFGMAARDAVAARNAPATIARQLVAVWDETVDAFC